MVRVDARRRHVAGWRRRRDLDRCLRRRHLRARCGSSGVVGVVAAAAAAAASASAGPSAPIRAACSLASISRPAASRSASSASCVRARRAGPSADPASAVLASAQLSERVVVVLVQPVDPAARRRAAFSASSASSTVESWTPARMYAATGSVLGQAPEAALTTLQLGQAVLEVGDRGRRAASPGRSASKYSLRRLVGLLAQGLDRRRRRRRGGPRRDPPRREPRRDPCRGAGQPLRARRTGDGGAGRWAEATQGSPSLTPPRVRSSEALGRGADAAAKGGNPWHCAGLPSGCWASCGCGDHRPHRRRRRLRVGRDRSRAWPSPRPPTTRRAAPAGAVHDHTGDVVTGVKAPGHPGRARNPTSRSTALTRARSWRCSSQARARSR